MKLYLADEQYEREEMNFITIGEAMSLEKAAGNSVTRIINKTLVFSYRPGVGSIKVTKDI